MIPPRISLYNDDSTQPCFNIPAINSKKKKKINTALGRLPTHWYYYFLWDTVFESGKKVSVNSVKRIIDVKCYTFLMQEIKRDFIDLSNILS